MGERAQQLAEVEGGVIVCFKLYQPEEALGLQRQ